MEYYLKINIVYTGNCLNLNVMPHVKKTQAQKAA